MRKIKNTASVILAGGKGTRMKSGLNKLLHDISGKPLVKYVADTVIEAGIEKNIIVTWKNGEDIKKELGEKFEYVVQEKPLGTGHALITASHLLKGFHGDLCVFVGDSPFLIPEIVRNLIKKHRNSNADATLITTIFPKTPPYGRIIRDSTGTILRIVEAKDATPDELKIREVNTSHYCFKADVVLPLLSEIKNNNVKKEYYLTDIFEILTKHKKKIENILVEDYHIVLGINTREDFASALKLMYRRKNNYFMNRGVTIIDPDSTYIDNSVKIGSDTVIFPFAFIEKNSNIGKECIIGPFVKITNSKINDHCQIQYVSIDNSELAKGSIFGPFASLKDGKIQKNNKSPHISL